MALKLPRLQRTLSLAEAGGRPTQAFQLWWQRFAEQIEDNFNGLDLVQGDIEELNDTLAALDTDDIEEGASNLYYTTARAREAISATGNLEYNNTTGIMTLTLPGGTTKFLREDGQWIVPSGGTAGVGAFTLDDGTASTGGAFILDDGGA